MKGYEKMKELNIKYCNADTHFVYAGNNPLVWVEIVRNTYGDEYDDIILVVPLSRKEMAERFGVENAVLGDIISSPEITQIEGMNINPVGICVLGDDDNTFFNHIAIENALSHLFKGLKSGKIVAPIVFNTGQTYGSDIVDLLSALISKVNVVNAPVLVDMGVKKVKKGDKVIGSYDYGDISSMISSKSKKSKKKKDKKKNKKKDKKKKDKSKKYKKGWKY